MISPLKAWKLWRLWRLIADLPRKARDVKYLDTIVQLVWSFQEVQNAMKLPTLTQLLKSWTVVGNVLALLALVFGSQEILAFISPEHAAEALAFINLILRFKTTVALHQK